MSIEVRAVEGNPAKSWTGTDIWGHRSSIAYAPEHPGQRRRGHHQQGFVSKATRVGQRRGSTGNDVIAEKHRKTPWVARPRIDRHRQSRNPARTHPCCRGRRRLERPHPGRPSLPLACPDPTPSPGEIRPALRETPRGLRVARHHSVTTAGRGAWGGSARPTSPIGCCRTRPRSTSPFVGLHDRLWEMNWSVTEPAHRGTRSPVPPNSPAGKARETARSRSFGGWNPRLILEEDGPGAARRRDPWTENEDMFGLGLPRCGAGCPSVGRPVLGIFPTRTGRHAAPTLSALALPRPIWRGWRSRRTGFSSIHARPETTGRCRDAQQRFAVRGCRPPTLLSRVDVRDSEAPKGPEGDPPR